MSNDAEFTLRLINEVSGPANEAAHSVSEVTGHFKLAGEGSKVFAEFAGHALERLAEKAIEAALKVGELGIEFAKGTVEAAAFAQASTLAINSLTHGAADGAKEFDNVRQMAQGLGLDVHDTVHSFQELLAAQFSIGQSNDIIKLGGDLQVIGADAQQVKSVFLAMSQIKSIGVLQGGDIRQLEQAGVSGKLIYEALAKSLGKTTAEIQKMQAAGKIDADTGISAIMEAVKHKVGEKELGDVGRKFADSTLQGMMGKLKGGLDNAMIDLGQRMQPGLDKVGGLISETLNNLQSSGKLEALGNELMIGFEHFVGFIESNWPAIEGAIMGTIDAIISGVKLAVSALQWLADNWETVKTVLEGVAIVLAILAAAWVLVNIEAIAVVGAIMLVAGAIGFVVNAVVAAVQWFDNLGVQWGEAARGWAGSLIDGLVGGIADYASRAIDAVRGLGSNIADAFTGVLQIGSPSQLFHDFGGDTVFGYVGGVVANDTLAADATKGLAQSAIDGFGAPELQMRGATASQTGAAMQSVEAAPARAPAGNNTFAVNVTVTGADTKDAQGLGDTIAARIRREMNAMIESAA
jgi:tape measure domain-containing protein